MVLNLATFGARINPAYAAALALVAIQVSIGILFKVAQSDGRYAFSASSSVTISEFLKFLLSSVLFYRECAGKHAAAPLSTTSVKTFCTPDEERAADDEEEREDQAFLKHAEVVANGIESVRARVLSVDFKTFHRYVKQAMPIDASYGFAFLALFYVLINNTVFLQYKLADPGTIQLIKSGTTLITAVVSIVSLGTTIVSGQWIAISLQVCGIVVTQYKETGAAYPLSTYVIIVFATTVSAIASVYNQKLCKSVDASMHVMNMYLYLAGSVINLLLHLVTRMMKPDEPSFFTGFDSIGSLLVILSNVTIGLAMTAVYKYADAIIKCFATAMSTAILLYLSPILFGTGLSFLAVPGTSVVFLATWLYMDTTPRRETEFLNVEDRTAALKQKSASGKILFLLSPRGRLRSISLSAAILLVLAILSALTFWENAHIQTKFELSLNVTNGTMAAHPPTILRSPFNKTMAFVRWNSKHEERIPIIRIGYTPFFHSLHYSMPEGDRSSGSTSSYTVNLTHDSFEDPYSAYRAVRDTMAAILNQTTTDDIDGLMFFHFDAWVDPLGFADMDFQRIWFPDSTNPMFKCMKSTGRYSEWWGWGQGYHEKALQATRFVASLHDEKYVVDPDEWCVGWSDIYYIPRRFFHDFITLTDIFISIPVFHEVAIPTILHIIDKTYERRPSRSLIYKIGDCWGDCCADDPTREDVFWSRCGHRLNLQHEAVTTAHFRRLRQHALMLGSEVDEDGRLRAVDAVNGTWPW